MDYKTYTNRVRYLLDMIDKGCISGPEEAARKFDCSERTIRRMINHLRAEGHAIQYSKGTKKYFSGK